MAGGRGSFVRRQILYQRFELCGVHHGAETLGHDPRELLVALRDGRRRVEDLLADRLRVAPGADVREIGRDHLALPLQLVTGEAPRGLDDGFGISAAARKGSATPSPTPPRGGWGGWGGRWDIGRGYVHCTALGFEERDHRPDLRGRELL